MKTKNLESFPPGNTFLCDSTRMGTTIGTNVVVMMERHSNERQDYIIICNTETGERLYVDLRSN